MPVCWGITDGSAGMQAQLRALASALGCDLEMKTCRLKRPFVWLPNCVFAVLVPLLPRKLLGLLASKDSDRLEAPLPQLVLSCGRRSVPFALWVKRHSKAFAVHIQDPYINPACFDMVVAMAHDKLARKASANVVVTRFALHAVTPPRLGEAAQNWRHKLESYPAPRIAVLIGGSTNRYTLSAQGMLMVIGQLEELHAKAGSLWITASRRTGAENTQRLREAFEGKPNVYGYSGEGENPYWGFLALSDAIVVTDDSVNMMTEAAATGKPLYLLNLPRHADTKPARFAQALLKEGIARRIEDYAPAAKWNYAIPDEAEKVAREIQKRLSS